MASVSEVGLAALKSREGVRLTAYRDSVGVPTIGWGHTLGVKMGDTITTAQAEEFLRKDIDTHAAPILAAIKVPVEDHERDALVSIAFNIGVGAFKGSTFLSRLNKGDHAGCAEAIMWWKSPSEILSRRTAERDQFLTPYSVRLPKARSTDARPVGVPVIPVETKPLPPLSKPAPGYSGALEPVKVESKPSLGSWLMSKLSLPWG
jgi:lysozyme